MGYKIITIMNYFLILLLTNFFSLMTADNDKAWISENFANHIINNKIMQSRDIFPIVGFQKTQGTLYILTYGGELQPVLTKETNEGFLISNFQYTINLYSWPKTQINRYNEAKVYYQYIGDKIKVKIIIGKQIQNIYYISNIYGSTFRNLLELKGWLLDFLLPSYL